MLVDATALPPDRGGVGRYVDQLVGEFSALGVQPIIACQDRDADHFGSIAGVTVRSVGRFAGSRAARLAWEQTALPRLIRRTDAELLFSPHYTTAVCTAIPRVVTLHDATFFSDPDLHHWGKGPFFRAWTRLSLRVARVSIVPSQATRDELVARAGADNGRLILAHHGVDHVRFQPPTEAAVTDLCARLGVRPRQYVAFLGTLEPRKNVPALIRGWAAAVADRTDPPALVLSGGPGWDENLPAALAAVPAHLRVVRTGYLDALDLPALLGGAIVVAYPSLGEGFGLPVLEAMACGATVLTTRRLALPEIGGDAVAYTEPDSSAIAAALRALLEDGPRRAALATAAQTRAATFTWRRSAEAHVRAFEQARQ